MNIPVWQILIALILGVALIAAAWHSHNLIRQRNLRQASLLDECKDLFTTGTKRLAETGYPRLAGEYQGEAFDLQLVKDTLNVRKLPTLWLLVTLPKPMPVTATFDLMMRPRGVEIFSKFNELPVQVPAPAGFPEDCSIRTDNASRLPSQDLVLHHMGLLKSPEAKELVISPNGLRIVWLAEEANPARYLLFRDAELGQVPVNAAKVKDLMDYLLALRDDLQATQGPPA